MMKKKISFGVTWSVIGCAAIFCFYTSQLLTIANSNFFAMDAYASGSDSFSDSVQPRKPAINNPKTNKETNMVNIKTNFGEIKIELFPDKAPKTVANFEKLATEGFYNGTKFHRVIKGFMIQGGDPLSKNTSVIERWGQGGPGYQFNDEINSNDALYAGGYAPGILAMANSGPNTQGSQFFIMHEKNNLQPHYTIFGRVTSGMDVVNKIANVETFRPGQVDRPLIDVVIEKVTVQ